MWKGTLDGFSFDSDEEAGKNQKATHPSDQNEHAEEHTPGKSKRKADKTSVSFSVASGFRFVLINNWKYYAYILSCWKFGCRVLKRKEVEVPAENHSQRYPRKKLQVPREQRLRNESKKHSITCYICLVLELKIQMLNQFTNDRDGKSAIDQLLLEFLPNPVQENLKNIVCWMSYYQFLLIYVPPYYQTWFSISICLLSCLSTYLH